MNNILPENIKRLRMEKNLTQKELAYKLGIAGATISAYESGTRVPSITILCKMAAFFSTSVDYIIGYIPPNDKRIMHTLENEMISLVHETFSNYWTRCNHYF